MSGPYAPAIVWLIVCAAASVLALFALALRLREAAGFLGLVAVGAGIVSTGVSVITAAAT